MAEILQPVRDELTASLQEDIEENRLWEDQEDKGEKVRRERHGDSREMNMALHVATLYVCYFPRLFATWPFTSLLQLLDSRRALTLQLGVLDSG